MNDVLVEWREYCNVEYTAVVGNDSSSCACSSLCFQLDGDCAVGGGGGGRNI